MFIKQSEYKYMRIQGRELAENTMHGKGIFSVAVKMVKDKIMDEEDADLYKEIDAIFAEILPFPPQCNNQEKVICYFKTENTEEMLKFMKPVLWLLDKYEHPYDLIYTNYPGEIVYEDQYQVVVKVEEPIIEPIDDHTV